MSCLLCAAHHMCVKCLKARISSGRHPTSSTLHPPNATATDSSAMMISDLRDPQLSTSPGESRVGRDRPTLVVDHHGEVHDHMDRRWRNTLINGLCDLNRKIDTESVIWKENVISPIYNLNWQKSVIILGISQTIR